MSTTKKEKVSNNFVILKGLAKMRVKCCLKLTESCKNLINIRNPTSRNARSRCNIVDCSNKSHWCCSACDIYMRRQKPEQLGESGVDENDY